MHCELYIPNFFPSEGLPRGDGLAAAETLIARGRRRRRALCSPEAWLFGRFGVARQRDWPVAPYTLLADGGAPERNYWMRADPVHLQVGRDSLGLADSTSFDVSRAESEALVEALNRHFGQTMLFHPLQPARWYVRLQKTPDMQTTPAAAARGAALDEKLPSGSDAMRFHALMNEAQMLLHEHPVNAEREARGEPALNSVWFWGGGVIDAAKARPFSAVFADDPLARGLALAAAIPVRALPRDSDSVLAALGDEGIALVVLNVPREAQPRERRAALERDWFLPLLAALKSGRIGMLTLHLCGADSLLEVETVRSDLRYFWRLRKPLSAYA
ncbi:MAG: phosphoglycerate mutase [Betaproteobacteria bacterium]|nr:MAG: phosphoglycerate mutase [Betaproteobacteria bacterium]TMH84943.1 MAG: phosphoglycerate mutase [Betaproteobacteria bacterium]